MKKFRRQRKTQPAQTGNSNIPRPPAVPPKKHNSPTVQLELNAVIPYDENLLERSRTQWQFGDWPRLAQLNRDTLQHHPDRAKLALLAAAGRLQAGQNAEATQFMHLAQDWGVSKKLISQILIAGVHNSIARAAAIVNQPHRALRHFESAIATGTPGVDAKLITQARASEQLTQLGLLTAQFALPQPTIPKVPTSLKADEIIKRLSQEAKFKVNADKSANNSNCRYIHQNHAFLNYEHKSDWLNCFGTEKLRGFTKKEIEQRLTYGSYIGDLLNYVFIETPKAACSSIKWILYEIENRSNELIPFKNESTLEMSIHYRDFNKINSLMDIDSELRIKILRDTRVVRFCVVRNPYSRLVSSWANKIRQREPGYDHFCCEIADLYKTSPDDISFFKFAQWVTEKQDPQKCNPHWKPMTNLLLPGIIDYTHVLHTENITEELQSILNIISPKKNALELLTKYRINESIPVEWKKLYNETLADMVYSYYKEDFDFFGYSPISWTHLDHKNKTNNDIEQLQIELQKSQNISIKAIQSRNLMISKLHEQLSSK